MFAYSALPTFGGFYSSNSCQEGANCSMPSLKFVESWCILFLAFSPTLSLYQISPVGRRSAVFPLLVFGQSSGRKFVWVWPFSTPFYYKQVSSNNQSFFLLSHILRPGRLSRPLLFLNDQEPIEISPHTHLRLVVWLLDRQSLKLRILRFCLRFLPEPPPSL